MYNHFLLAGSRLRTSVTKHMRTALAARQEETALDAWRQAAVPKLIQALSRPDRTNLRDHTVDSVMHNYMHYSFWGQQQQSHPMLLSYHQGLESRRFRHRQSDGSPSKLQNISLAF
jgi:hypothetical protein